MAVGIDRFEQFRCGAYSLQEQPAFTLARIVLCHKSTICIHVNKKGNPPRAASSKAIKYSSAGVAAKLLFAHQSACDFHRCVETMIGIAKAQNRDQEIRAPVRKNVQLRARTRNFESKGVFGYTFDFGKS